MRTIVVVLAMGLGCAMPAAAQPTPVLIDRDMTAGAGATVTNGVGRLVAHTEDRFIPLRLFEERGKLRHGGAFHVPRTTAAE